MGAYILRRVLIIPTMIGIMAIRSSCSSPRRPVERSSRSSPPASRRRRDLGRRRLQGVTQPGRRAVTSLPRAQGLDPNSSRLRQCGFDKPAYERFGLMLWNYLRFDFGQSYFRDVGVLQLIKEKLPVSMSLGITLTLLTYLISIPLGIRKAVEDGSPFEPGPQRHHRRSTASVFDPADHLFTDGCSSYFAARLFSRTAQLSGSGIPDLWHIALPVLAMALGAFATSTLLTKNSFLDEIRKQYVLTARMKGLSERGVLYRHVFRNAMLIVIAGFPAAFISVFFTGSLLIENIFSLDGLGCSASRAC
jgi:microcin C transport system permease protein